MHRHTSLRPLHIDDKGHDKEHEDHQDDQLQDGHGAALDTANRRKDGSRQTDYDATEDDQRDAVADSTLGDLLAEPHHECGAGGQGQHRDEAKAPARVGYQRATSWSGHALQPERDRNALNHGDTHGQIAGVLGDLAPTQFTLLRELLEIRPDDGQQLQDDGGRDVGHDPQGKHRHPLQAAAREGIDETEERSLHGLHELHQSLGIDTRSRDIAADSIDRQQAKRKRQPLAQIRDRKDIAKTLDHDSSTSQEPPAASIFFLALALNLCA